MKGVERKRTEKMDVEWSKSEKDCTDSVRRRLQINQSEEVEL